MTALQRSSCSLTSEPAIYFMFLIMKAAFGLASVKSARETSQHDVHIISPVIKGNKKYTAELLRGAEIYITDSSCIVFYGGLSYTRNEVRTNLRMS